MTKFEKIQTTVYAALWAFAIYVIAQDVISPREVQARTEPAPVTKLTAKQVMQGARK